MNWRSTTLRIAALVFLLQLAASVVLLLGVGVIVRRQSEAHATATAGVVRNDLLATYADGGMPALTDEVARRSERLITPGVVMLVVDRDGRRLAGNLRAWPGALVPGAPSEVRLFRSGHAVTEAMRVRATCLPGGGRLLTGAIVESERRLLHYLGAATLVAIILATAFAAVAAALITRLIVDRLGRTAATLRAVRAGDLGRRVEDDGSGDAFAALARETNAALDRLDALLDEVRLATDALAHDLKSPLTRLRVALDRVARTVQDLSAQVAVERGLLESDRLMGIVETALRISRAEAGIGRDNFVPVNLATELEDIAEIYGPVVEDAGRGIRVLAPTPVMLPVHRELLAQALGNLVDNALKYGAGTVELSLATSAEGITIGVADEGGGIPERLHGISLQRFGRIDEARSQTGAGLGLSLVAATARLHDGAVRLVNKPAGLSSMSTSPHGHRAEVRGEAARSCTPAPAVKAYGPECSSDLPLRCAVSLPTCRASRRRGCSRGRRGGRWRPVWACGPMSAHAISGDRGRRRSGAAAGSAHPSKSTSYGTLR